MQLVIKDHLPLQRAILLKQGPLSFKFCCVLCHLWIWQLFCLHSQTNAEEVGEDSDDEDYESEETPLESYETPLDKDETEVDEYQIFKNVLQSECIHFLLPDILTKIWWSLKLEGFS